jgi:hypothetical protein
MSLTPYLVTLDIKQNEKPGVLIPINDFELDMHIKRVFYIYGFSHNEKQNNRGYHAHETTKQVLININGSVKIITKSFDSSNEHIFYLDQPHLALVVPPHNFIKMEQFSQDSIFLVLCDTIFTEDIYIYENNNKS